MALALLGTTLSVSNNITPFLAIIQRAKANQLDQVPKNYVLLNHICQLFWICYSLRVKLFGLILVNSLTCILSFCNNIVLNYYLNDLHRFLPYYTVLASLIISTCFFGISIEFNGVICIILGISSTASIFESIFRTIKTGNHMFIDLKISLSIFGTGCTWFTYAVVANEGYAIYTSGFSTFMGTLMIITHMIYKLNSRNAKVEKAKWFTDFYNNIKVIAL
jgi:hypothetical protein